jgi:hypothetical protein
MVVTQFIETMEILHVKGSNKNIRTAGDYIRVEGPFEKVNDYFNYQPSV